MTDWKAPTIPNLDLKGLREAAMKATAGPWEARQTFHRSHVFAVGLDGHDYVVANCNASLTFTTASNRERDEANALFIATFNPQCVLALLRENEALRRERDEAQGDRAEYRDLLHDLVMLDGEEWAIGGGPGFKERSEKAWSRARERFEP